MTEEVNEVVKTGTVIHLPKLDIDIVLNEIKVDDEDENLLNIEYDYNNDDIDKEDIDEEITEIIMNALDDAVRNTEKLERSNEDTK